MPSTARLRICKAGLHQRLPLRASRTAQEALETSRGPLVAPPEFHGGPEERLDPLDTTPIQ